MESEEVSFGNNQGGTAKEFSSLRLYSLGDFFIVGRSLGAAAKETFGESKPPPYISIFIKGVLTYA